jgi:hypothetical protein
LESKIYRGSRKHILDWVERPEFADEFRSLLEPTGAVPVLGTWLPRGYISTREARLETYGPRYVQGVVDWPALRDWWLVHTRGANTPNWDLVAVCRLAGNPALALVEAKANGSELSCNGKKLGDKASKRSRENHARIRKTLFESSTALAALVPGVRISIDTHYQLANRLAFSWKLSSLGLPVILVYLGFTGDYGIVDAGEPLRDCAHWRDVFLQYCAPVAPAALFDHELAVCGTPLWMLIRARPILSPSAPARAVRPIAAKITSGASGGPMTNDR